MPESTSFDLSGMDDLDLVRFGRAYLAASGEVSGKGALIIEWLQSVGYEAMPIPIKAKMGELVTLLMGECLAAGIRAGLDQNRLSVIDSDVEPEGR